MGYIYRVISVVIGLYLLRLLDYFVIDFYLRSLQVTLTLTLTLTLILALTLILTLTPTLTNPSANDSDNRKITAPNHP